MNFIQKSVANNPMLYSVLMALLGFLLLISMTFFLMASNEINKMIKTSEEAVLERQQIIAEATNTLLEVSQKIAPECTIHNLDVLRRIQFKANTIGDIGIHNNQGKLLCSSFLGILESPYNSASLDATLSHNNQPFGYIYQKPVLIGDNRVEALLIYYKEFNVVIKPSSFNKVLQGDIALIQTRNGNGELITVVENPNVAYTTRQLFFKQDDIVKKPGQTNYLRFDPLTLNVLLTHAPQGENKYYFYSGISLSEKFENQQQTLWLLSLLYLFMSFLVYKIFNDKFSKWANIGYQIRQLLDPKHIRCYYQPVIDLATNKVIGAEVLMRIHQNDTLYFPDNFFPEVIKQNLQGSLDQAVVETLLEDLSREPLPLSIKKLAINFFPETIGNGRAKKIIQNFLAHKSASFTLTLEILEQDLHGYLFQEINAIRNLGVTISIDDFGTGYSNLSSIKDLSPEVLKIDRSFVKAIDTTSIQSSLIPEIINIARAVNAEVVAEGIEEVEQELALKRLGVEYVQGYYYAKAMPLAAFCDFVESYNAIEAKPSARNQERRILKSS